MMRMMHCLALPRVLFRAVRRLESDLNQYTLGSNHFRFKPRTFSQRLSPLGVYYYVVHIIVTGNKRSRPTNDVGRLYKR